MAVGSMILTACAIFVGGVIYVMANREAHEEQRLLKTTQDEEGEEEEQPEPDDLMAPVGRERRPRTATQFFEALED
ncbi:hypothetical protein HY374_01780 [Candidatus Berkelbacteria bacterium]|nr:hypothetical protein [Candidatus Berkelbacteria bacterium]